MSEDKKNNSEVTFVQSAENPAHWGVILGEGLATDSPQNVRSLVSGITKQQAYEITDNLQMALDANIDEIYFYEPGTSWAKDSLSFTESGLVGGYGKKPLNELLQAHPDGLVLTYDQVQEHIIKNATTLPKLITEQQYFRALGELPPLISGGNSQSSSFVSPEAITANVYSHFSKIGDNYYTMDCPLIRDHNELIKAVNEGMKNIITLTINVNPTMIAPLPQPILQEWAKSLPAAVATRAALHLHKDYRLALLVNDSADSDPESRWELAWPDGVEPPQSVQQQCHSIIMEALDHDCSFSYRDMEKLVQDLYWVPQFDMEENADKTRPYFMNDQGSIEQINSIEEYLSFTDDVVAVMYFDGAHSHGYDEDDRQALIRLIENEPTAVQSAKNKAPSEAWDKLENTIQALKYPAPKPF